MAVPLEIMELVLQAIGNVQGAIADFTGIIADVQSAIGVAQGALLQFEYLAAVPLIAMEFRGLVNVLMGSGELFIGTIKTLTSSLIPNTFDGVFTFFVFSISWMLCLFKNIGNMQTCIFYYILEAIGQILYLPVRIFLYFTSQVGINFYPLETRFWDGIEHLDKLVMGSAGFHISHYPKNIRNQCYNCKRLKVSTLMARSDPLVKDITEVAPRNLTPGIRRMIRGAAQLMNPFGR